MSKKQKEKPVVQEEAEEEGPRSIRFPRLPGNQADGNLNAELKKYQEIEAKLGKKSAPSQESTNKPTPQGSKRVKQGEVEAGHGQAEGTSAGMGAPQGQQVHSKDNKEQFTEYPEVFISGLAHEATDFDIRKHFEGVNIRSVKYLPAKKSEKFRSKCFIRVADEEAQQKALAYNNTNLAGVMISVVPVKKKGETERVSRLDRLAPTVDSKTILVRNLPKEFDDEDLVNEFSEFGPVVSARVVRETSGISKRYAFVEFSKSEEAKAALAKSGTEINGHRIGVVISVPKNTPEEPTDGKFRINRGNYRRNPDKQREGQVVQNVKSQFQGETFDL